MAADIKYPINPHRPPPKKRRTICEVLREIYRAAELRGDLETMGKCNEAHDYAKRMNAKLKQYKAHYGSDGLASLPEKRG